MSAIVNNFKTADRLETGVYLKNIRISFTVFEKLI
jgi:hypothetical protein